MRNREGRRTDVAKKQPSLALLIGLVLICAAPIAAEPLTALLGAVDVEVAGIRAALRDPVEQQASGLRVVRGELRGREVLVACTGVGKVNAAMTTTLLLEQFAPSELIFTGIAGALAPDLRPGDVVIGTTAVVHDFVALHPDTVVTWAPQNPADGERFPLFLPADARLCDLAHLAARTSAAGAAAGGRPEASPGPPARIVAGAIATGDAFVAARSKRQEIRARLGADAVEMEGAAIAQICHARRTPWLLIRGISDRADALASEEIEANFERAASNAARLAMDVVALLGSAPAAPAPVEDAAPREDAVGDACAPREN
ncbi:MAG: 5'-methylthioadenosine/adenosylhomocysteine nucleosidase [Candidatus Eisenbacteria bacterium]|nr:5'-methylthioadenosine/adenosylhomocysteine nucleosidase [Candidatus Eisenbacteria bacterium]